MALLKALLIVVVNRLGQKQFAADLLLLPLLILVCFAPRCGDRFFTFVETSGKRFVRYPRFCLASIALIAIAIRLSLLPVLPLPIPRVQDEFSYLLAGDTFAHGRLTNPTSPFWLFFDTVHVNQHPTYMSKYPPAQGAALAIGERIGNPWFGVVLSTALMCAAVLWALQGWLPPAFALLGGILILLRLALFSYWMNSYWGGSMAAIGGALVLGALPRIFRSNRLRDALLMGLGAAILANSRPFEGMIFFLPVAIFLGVRLCARTGPSLRNPVPHVVVPFVLVSAIALLFIAYYNWRGSGNPLLAPYLVNERTYFSTPALFWEKLRPPLHYANPQFEAFYNVWARAQWEQDHVDSFRQGVKYCVSVASKIAYFYLWPELLVPLIMLPWLIFDRRMRFLIIQTCICIAGFLLVPWFQPHYAAPLVSGFAILLTQAIRHLRHVTYKNRRVGVGLSRAVVLSAVFLAPFHPHVQDLGHPPLQGIDYRQQFENQLEHTPGMHLVIVRYSPQEDSQRQNWQYSRIQEWVYNGADLEHAKVIWAREIPGVDMRPLLDHYRDRDVWIAEPDASPPRLISRAADSPRQIARQPE